MRVHTEPSTVDPRPVFSGRQAILFDLDGTLYGGAAAEPYFIEVDRLMGVRIRHHFGGVAPLDAFDALTARMTEHPEMRSKSEALTGWFGISLAEMNRFREYHTPVEAMLPPAPEVGRLLTDLRGRFRLLLGTNNSPVLARRILKRLGIDAGVFEFIVSSEDVGVAKPDARFFDSVLRRARLTANACVSVGDRPESDLDPAAALGFATWHIRGPKDLEVLRALTGDVVT